MMKKWLIYFLHLSRKWQIAIVVWGLHLLVLFALTVNHLWTRHTQPMRPIAVRTFLPYVEPEIKAPLSTHIISEKTTKTAPKKKVSPPTKTKQPPSKPKSEPHVLKEVQQALAALDALPKQTALSVPLAIPKTLHLVENETSSPSQQSYGELLVTFLEHQLDFPEVGEVRMELQIDRQGRLLHHKILSSANQKNSDFLKNQLPELTFPCFNDFHIDKNSLTFTILFCNANKTPS
jgi:hypothetical protein